MKKICIMMPSIMPVPAVLGGAVETLVEMLIEENEKNPVFEFTVLSAYNEEAKKISKKYKYTKIIYINANSKFEGMYNKYIFRPIKKITKLALPDIPLRLKMVKYIKKNNDNFDWILYEGGETYSLLFYRKLWDVSKVLLHLHWTCKSNNRLDSSYAYCLSISDFVGNEWKVNSKKANKSFITFKNCIDIKKFTKKISNEENIMLKRSLGIKEDDFVLIFTGRIIPEKGVKELLQSISLIKDKAIKVIIIGSSNFGINIKTKYEIEIERLVDELGEKVVFTGYVENRDLYKYYNISNIAIIPSIWEEPAGLVVTEAMACGKPIITTATGGIKEYTDENCAIFINNKNRVEEELAEKIIYLMNNKEICEQMSKYAKEKANKYDSKSYLNNFEQIINKISDKREWKTSD